MDSEDDTTNHSSLSQPCKNSTLPPTKLQDFVSTYTPRHPISNYLTYQHLSFEHAVFLAVIFDVHEPQNLRRSIHMMNGAWTMHDELQTLNQNKTECGRTEYGV